MHFLRPDNDFAYLILSISFPSKNDSNASSDIYPTPNDLRRKELALRRTFYRDTLPATIPTRTVTAQIDTTKAPLAVLPPNETTKPAPVPKTTKPSPVQAPRILPHDMVTKSSPFLTPHDNASISPSTPAAASYSNHFVSWLLCIICLTFFYDTI